MATRKRPAKSTQLDVPDLLRGMEDAYLDCRDLRHVFQVVGYYRNGAGIVRRQLECARCGSNAIDTWDSQGNRIEPRHYQYAEGYQTRGTGGVDMSDVRVEKIRRATVYRSRGAMVSALNGNVRPIKRQAS